MLKTHVTLQLHFRLGVGVGDSCKEMLKDENNAKTLLAVVLFLKAVVPTHLCV